MNFDDFAELAGEAAREAARGATRPEIGVVGAVRRRRSVAVVTAASFAGVMILIGAVAVWPGIRSDSDLVATETSVVTTSPTVTTSGVDVQLPEGLVFVPPRVEQDGMAQLDLTFPDGSSVVVAYPSDLDLTSRGLEASLLGTLGGGQRRLDVRYGSIEERVAFAEPFRGTAERVAVYPDGRGGGVERWEFTESGVTEAFLYFEFGSWTVEMPDALNASPESEAEWARALRGTETADGYLTLIANPPAEIVLIADQLGPDGPDLQISGESGDLLVFLNDCARMEGQFDTDYDTEVFAWCDEPTNTLLFAAGAPGVIEALHTKLEIRNVELASIPEPQAAFVAEGFCGTENVEDGWQDQAFQIGPLWLWTLGAGDGDGSYDPSTKTIAIVEPGSTVTLRIPQDSRSLVSHLFDPSSWNQAGAYRIADGGDAVTFAPCDDQPSQNVGGFVFAEGHGCVELEITIDNEPPRRVAVPVGGGCDPNATPTIPQTLTTYVIGETVWINTDCPIGNGILRSDNGDGLPKKGQTDKQRVDAVFAETKEALVAAFAAVDAQVIPRNGQVWDGPGDGVYTIEDAPDYQIRVTLTEDSPCPEGPYSWNGIPVVFFRE